VVRPCDLHRGWDMERDVDPPLTTSRDLGQLEADVEVSSDVESFVRGSDEVARQAFVVAAAAVAYGRFAHAWPVKLAIDAGPGGSRVLEVGAPAPDLTPRLLGRQMLGAVESAGAAPSNSMVDLAVRFSDVSRDGAQSELPASCRLDVMLSGTKLKLKLGSQVFGDRDRLQSVARHVGRVSQSFLKSPDVRLDHLEWIDPDDRWRLLAFSGIARRRPENVTILDLVEQQVCRHGEAVAFTCEEMSLTYAALDGKANHLARFLVEVGIGSGDLVPIVTTNCLELPLAMLAVMKSGGAFVPVDAGWPQARLRGVLDALDPKIVLTTPTCRNAGDLGRRVHSVRSSDLDPAAAPVACTRATQSDLIYGFYTSGSTGIPKCALNLHRGLLNRFLCMTERFGGHTSDVVLQNSKHVFDSSIWQTLWPLTNGARVVIPPDSGGVDLPRTIALIERERVTMTDFVPSIFNILVRYLESRPQDVRRVSSLRQVLIGGEEISPKFVALFRRMVAGVGVTNTYGPTEASIGMIFHEVTDADADEIPLGRPLPNTYAVILDDEGGLVPIGALGEICIGGVCLGSGYLNDSAKTDRAFVRNPFEEIPGERLYRTGDIGYQRQDGRFWFVGRRDNQVKVGGVRIELGEIEAAALRHPGILEAKVTVEDPEQAVSTIAAYVVGRPGLTEDDVLSHLKDHLPSYSCPKRIVLLERMPLNANGKIDRGRLRAAYVAQKEAVAEGAEDALSETEERVRALWRRVLGLRQIRADEDFFALGGDSLLALEVVLAIQDQFDRELTPIDLYEHSTIRRIAAHLDQPNREDAAAHVAFRDDIQLDPAIAPRSPVPGKVPREVFVTGGTGFIGIHLVAEILERSSARITCLVRSSGAEEARARIRQAANLYEIDLSPWLDRLDVASGDLSRERMGLAPIEYERLAERIDTVAHLGALVNFLHDYPHHRNHNVVGTEEVLRFATHRSPKWIHYTSTLGVLGSHRAGWANEDAESLPKRPPPGGYSESKWVADHLAHEARSRGAHVAIYRIGEVMAAATRGIPNQCSLFLLFLKSCRELKACPVSAETFDYLPVDFVVRFLVNTMVGGSVPETYHVFHPIGTTLACVATGLRRAGVELEEVASDTFWQRLADRCRVPQVTPELLLLWTIAKRCGAPEAHDLFLSEGRKLIDQRNFADGVSRSALEIPRIADEMLATLGRRFV